MNIGSSNKSIMLMLNCDIKRRHFYVIIVGKCFYQSDILICVKLLIVELVIWFVEVLFSVHFEMLQSNSWERQYIKYIFFFLEKIPIIIVYKYLSLCKYTIHLKYIKCMPLLGYLIIDHQRHNIDKKTRKIHQIWAQKETLYIKQLLKMF